MEKGNGTTFLGSRACVQGSETCEPIPVYELSMAACFRLQRIFFETLNDVYAG